MRRAIVTGGTGFIGSWLIQELLNKGVKITAIVRNRARLLDCYSHNSNITIIEKDLAALEKEDFPQREYDVFFHLGWSGVAPEDKNKIDLQLQNIAMSLHTLEVAARIGCHRFIASGTVS